MKKKISQVTIKIWDRPFKSADFTGFYKIKLIIFSHNSQKLIPFLNVNSPK